MLDQQKSMYLPSEEHDSCGIGLIAQLRGEQNSKLVQDAIDMLESMEHRGATVDALTGDGAGILLQIDHDFFKKECSKIGFELPESGSYGIGMVFFPSKKEEYAKTKKVFEECASELDFKILGYRAVPKSNDCIGEKARSTEPIVEQVFVVHKDNLKGEDLEKRLFVLRNYSSHSNEGNEDFYICTFSYKIITYKGQFTTNQLRPYYKDLQGNAYKSAVALVHSRYSTNTFPKWKLAQPFRYIAHNGEINTITGNVGWTRSSEKLFESTDFSPEDFKKVLPLCNPTFSDSSNLDNMIEMLNMGGRTLPHVMMMLIPEAWQGMPEMEKKKRDFYRYHASITEPWDGPASICFTDGKIVGATLDRNGLRPSRYCITNDDRLILSSEAGALKISQDIIVKKGRLEPGKILVADLTQGKIISDEDLKSKLSSQQDYGKWIKMNSLLIKDLPEPKEVEEDEIVWDEDKILQMQHAFGVLRDDLRFMVAPMASTGKDPVGSMGADIPLAILSKQSQHISNYFKQQFAQVSNPPIDPIRERPMMSLRTYVGRIFNILSETPNHCKQIIIRHPVITNEELLKLKYIQHPDFRSATINAVFNADGKEGRMEEALTKICKEAEKAVLDKDVNILIISDRNISKEFAPIPSLIAIGAVHHYLTKKCLRVRTCIIVEAGDIRETHHFATLIGYGATGVNPYLTFETIKELIKSKAIPEKISIEKAFENYKKAIADGLLKIASKMGISTMQSYQGAQIFEAIGLSSKVIEKCFKGTVSQIEGIDFDGLAREVLVRQKHAFADNHFRKVLPVGGIYQWKRRGELHMFNPETIHKLQMSTKLGDYKIYKEFANIVNNQEDSPITIRGLFNFNPKRKPISIDQVEPKEAIFKRFVTGAMSFGSISHEAHSTLAIAMNRLGGKSNSGEGGEDEIRFTIKDNGDSERSAVKQVASGRFGVTINYLTNADEIQIKMAQGAKPGEGGQLPGDKVDEWIGRVRHSTPGVQLISPPPHHDIYSIEDLKQLIFDLKNANPNARISVKLVSKAGVGTIAAGVAKAFADVVIIAGHDGGTGASPLSSIQHAGTAWELGLSETHQTLVRNRLRERITVQVDGQIRTGRDLAIATMLGAEEWGIATAALVVSGCVMMRKCHLNTCPVGIATQDKRLRAKFGGKVEWVMNYFEFLVQDLREIMAELGFRTVNEMVGQVDCLKTSEKISHWKPKALDLSPILYKEPDTGVALFKSVPQKNETIDVLDHKLIAHAKPALEKGEHVFAEYPIINTDRTVGTMLSYEISKKYGSTGLSDDKIHFKFRGSAGQSFGAFGAKGLKLELEGEANDYFGKGLSGGVLIVYPDRISKLVPEENVIVGNVAFYGATSGDAYIRGIAGERFGVRNSGANVVVEGLGAHGCEYMTGGNVVVLGEIGRNFAAGMSGGYAYIYDKFNSFKKHVSQEMHDFGRIEYEDESKLKKFIENHFYYTKSSVAKAILDNWDLEVDKFIKVFPSEYKNALAKLKNQNK